MTTNETAQSIAQHRAAAGIIAPITPQQVRDYSPQTSPDQAQAVATAHNETWAGRSWEIRGGEVVYL